jgi:hypothetical protein
MITFKQHLLESFECLVEEFEENGKFSEEEHSTALSNLKDLPTVPKKEIFFKNPDKEEVFLTDVGFKEHGRVYHVDDSDKKRIRRIRIDLKNIGKGQPTAQREGVHRAISIAYEKDTGKAEKVPLVVKENGTFYVQDGHHRVSAHLLAGRKTMIVDAIDKHGDKFYTPKDA